MQGIDGAMASFGENRDGQLGKADFQNLMLPGRMSFGVKTTI